MYKNWNWKQKDWPNFVYDKEALEALELEFMQQTGVVLGVLKHTNKTEQEALIVEILSNEALKSSEIEGEFLDRKSVQSSIKRNLGIPTALKKTPVKEDGIAKMMVDVYLNFANNLQHETLFNWHRLLLNYRTDLQTIGAYRTHQDPMQIVSGRIDKPTVHFEAPPSEKMKKEMGEFVQWFEKHHFKNKLNLLPLAKAGIAHFYFVTIHPFEDGNGRIGRAIAEKSIALSIGQPAFISLSKTIEATKKEYYALLEKHNTTLNITEWLLYFGKTVLNAQKNTLKELDFILKKTRFFDEFNAVLNLRQKKVIKRIFQEGIKGFDGGLSAKNYMTIAKTSASTATRDLKELTDKGILKKTGTLKNTRYFLLK